MGKVWDNNLLPLRAYPHRNLEKEGVEWDNLREKEMKQRSDKKEGKHEEQKDQVSPFLLNEESGAFTTASTEGSPPHRHSLLSESKHIPLEDELKKLDDLLKTQTQAFPDTQLEDNVPVFTESQIRYLMSKSAAQE
eukprot:CAMPEP_0170548050 /NCGR_PEP_ID=MMETSP0211-20121228/6373_1 /TAXON_ID=311385 /ORGANISM="Pseudokeronopsis sp., Strain OXSARD2" /LENGTH=135 /DNA_ID=CAMNT_0010853361 /DNA_START=413 /DNA_END=820 /DNA_ORIENTATION=+